MGKVIRKIPGFFMLFAGLAICAHLIIPHDHHLIESSSGQQDTCPFSKEGTGHHRGNPVHCHAFNDLASEKAITFILIKSIQSAGFIRKVFPNASEIPFTSITFLEISVLYQVPNSSDLKFLRAPPSLI